jgi:hypothetical protein
VYINCSGFTAYNGRMIGNDELERMRKEAIVDYFKITLQRWLGTNDKTD